MIKKELQNLRYSAFSLRMWKATWRISTYSFPVLQGIAWGDLYLCHGNIPIRVTVWLPHWSSFFFLCILYRIIDAIGLWHMRDIFTIFLWRSYSPLSASVQDDSKNWEWTFPTMINQRTCDYPHRECSYFILLLVQHSVPIHLRMGSGKNCYFQIEFSWPKSQFLH